MTFKVPEQHRLDARACAAVGAPLHYGTDAAFGNYGMFLLPPVVPGRRLKAIASEGQGWEHVSVSIAASPHSKPRKLRVPTWLEMCAVKDLFWGPEDVVMQLHPRASAYVNHHEACLHLWRPRPGGDFGTIPEPPALLVGPVD